MCFLLSLPNTVLVKLPSGEVKKTTMKQGQVEVTKVAKPIPSGSAPQKRPDQKTDKKEVRIEKNLPFISITKD